MFVFGPRVTAGRAAVEGARRADNAQRTADHGVDLIGARRIKALAYRLGEVGHREGQRVRRGRLRAGRRPGGAAAVREVQAGAPDRCSQRRWASSSSSPRGRHRSAAHSLSAGEAVPLHDDHVAGIERARASGLVLPERRERPVAVDEVALADEETPHPRRTRREAARRGRGRRRLGSTTTLRRTDRRRVDRPRWRCRLR